MTGSTAPKTNGMAIAGFVLSLVGCSPLGLIFSILGMNQTKADPSQGGRGLAIAGLVISIIGLVGYFFYFVLVGAALSTL